MKYNFYGTETQWQRKRLTVEATSYEEAVWKAHDHRYNEKGQWKNVGKPHFGDKIEVELDPQGTSFKRPLTIKAL
jgi:hypothetical protein